MSRCFGNCAALATAVTTAVIAAALFSSAPVGADTDGALVVVAGPMSGDYEQYGASVRIGAELAVEDQNAAGGLLGVPLRIEVVDDNDCDVDRATEIAEDIVDLGPAVVVGHLCSGVSIPASEVYARNGIIQITPASSNPRMTEGNDSKPTIFRSYGRDDRQGNVAAAFINSRWPNARTFIVHISEAYDDYILDTAISTFREYGIDVEWVSYDAERNSPDDTVETLIAHQAAVVYVIGYTGDTATFLREAKKAGLAAVIVGTDSLMTEEVLDLAGDAAEGVYFTAHPSVELNSFAQSTVTRLKAADVEYLDYAVYAYVAVQEYVQAATAAAQLDAEAVAEQLHDGNLLTAIGPIRFDEHGDIAGDFWAIYQFAGGKIEPVPETHWTWLD